MPELTTQQQAKWKLALDLATPMCEGPFETTCHTAAGNDITLFIQTTRELHKHREWLFNAVWKRSRRAYPALKERIPGTVFAFPGFMALNDVCDWMGRGALHLYKESKKLYLQQVGEPLAEDHHTYDDYFNALFREFTQWLNENVPLAK